MRGLVEAACLCHRIFQKGTAIESNITMPIFEYYCPTNNRIYSFFARRPGMGTAVPRCPDGDELPMQKVISSFAALKGVPDPAEAVDADDPRAEQLMAEMEREMEGMDSENPDPRQLAKWMRKVAEVTGEKIPESLREAISRLEAGEDPESLEESLGGIEDLDDGSDSDSGTGNRMRNWLRRQMASRDETLYELNDFI